MAFFESTGKLIKSWWQSFFLAASAGRNRFAPLFIPWYAEPQTYRKPAPADWMPSDQTVRHAEAVERTSAQWMCGRTVHLERDQLYFWEFTHNEYQDRGELGVFYNEFCSDPSEAFRAANQSVFSYETMEWLRSGTSVPRSFLLHGPGTDPQKILADQMGLQEANPF